MVPVSLVVHLLIEQLHLNVIFEISTSQLASAIVFNWFVIAAPIALVAFAINARLDKIFLHILVLLVNGATIVFAFLKELRTFPEAILTLLLALGCQWKKISWTSER